MRSIQVLGKPVSGWQVLPAEAPDFATSALRASELVLAGDPRIGKVPGTRTSTRSKKRKSVKNSRRDRARRIRRCRQTKALFYDLLQLLLFLLVQPLSGCTLRFAGSRAFIKCSCSEANCREQRLRHLIERLWPRLGAGASL